MRKQRTENKKTEEGEKGRGRVLSHKSGLTVNQPGIKGTGVVGTKDSSSTILKAATLRLMVLTSRKVIKASL